MDDIIRTEDELDEVLRLKLLPYNARLTNTRKKLGYTQKDIHLLTGFPIARIHLIETLKCIPTDFEKGEIASALREPVEYLFPEELELAIEAGVFDKREKHLTETQVSALRLWYTDSNIEEFEGTYRLKELVASALSTLTPKEQRVITLRFGFGSPDNVSKTMKDVGMQFGVTKERIRQIEAKALRKLRHPRRSRKLRGFIK